MAGVLPKPAFPVRRKDLPLSRGLVAGWAFYEGAGNQLYDLSDYNNNGTLQAAPTWSASQFGQALSFNGTSQYVVCTSTPALSLAAKPFSIAIWLNSSYVSNGGFARIISWYDGTNSIEVGVGGNNGPLQGFYLGKTGSANARAGSAINYPASIWHHIVATFDGGSSYNFYVDGQPDSPSVNFTGLVFLTTNNGNLYLGQRGDSARFMPGLLADVKIYNLALSAADVASLYFDSFQMYRPQSRWWEVAGAAPPAYVPYDPWPQQAPILAQ